MAENNNFLIDIYEENIKKLKEHNDILNNNTIILDKIKYISDKNKEQKNTHIINNKDDKDDKNNTKNEENKKSPFICVYCNKNFTRKDSLKKHQNGRCKNKIGEEDIKKIFSDYEKLLNKNETKIINNKQINNSETKIINNTIQINNNIKIV